MYTFCTFTTQVSFHHTNSLKNLVKAKAQYLNRYRITTLINSVQKQLNLTDNIFPLLLIFDSNYLQSTH